MYTQALSVHPCRTRTAEELARAQIRVRVARRQCALVSCAYEQNAYREYSEMSRCVLHSVC
jgi:hypothetical protein